MLYTKKGDNGTTKLFNCPTEVRLSKGDAVFTALGTIDELNAALGIAKTVARRTPCRLLVDGKKIPYESIIETIQDYLFIIQAELGGSPLSLTKAHVTHLETILKDIDDVLPPVHSFSLPGGSELGAHLDFTRTIGRRAERMVVKFNDCEIHSVSAESLQFLNRLSSALFGLARFANYYLGETEKAPQYRKAGKKN